MNKYQEALNVIKENVPYALQCNGYINSLQESVSKIEKYDLIEKEIECPIDVLIKALRNGVYCVDYKTGELKWILRGFVNCVYNGDTWGFVDDRILYAESEDKPFSVYNWKDYKVTWFLKEDKSE